ncbi:MAG: phosphate ABC transporter substrate-binding protein PstS family protein [Acidimicrobiia bacterium]|nr:phosphate ABC transporter substrate-binding protein PstS family protein [Acidimicrobiia bacterium]
MTRKLLLLGAALALVAAACGGGDSTSDTTAAPSDGSLSGSIFVSGSSTVEPISALNAEKFNAMHPNVGVTVEGPGTGDGFKKFCAGESDISDASRAIKESEAEECAAAGIEYVELQVAIDGLSVITSIENNAVSCLTFHDIYALVGPESTGFQNWSDANDLAGDLGGTTAPYPDAPLVVTAPGEESGTYDTFVELVIDDLAEEREQQGASRPDYQASANDNVIIEGISGTATSLGWVGYAFFAENTDKVTALAVDDGESGCVAPTADTIADGSYPLSRPLFIYVNKAKTAERPELAAFVDFYLSEAGLESVNETGYVELASYEDVIAAWESR